MFVHASACFTYVCDSVSPPEAVDCPVEQWNKEEKGPLDDIDEDTLGTPPRSTDHQTTWSRRGVEVTNVEPEWKLNNQLPHVTSRPPRAACTSCRTCGPPEEQH